MKKSFILYLAGLALSLLSIACSETPVAVKPTDNHAFTTGEVEEIARKFDPDCRKFAAASDNTAPAG
jgi:hypothetical protein